jgi:HipA-like protein
VFRKKPKVLVQFGSLSIGELRREDGSYVFSYLPGFFRADLKALSDFPDPAAGKLYRSRHLWPFFANRIPDLNRDDVQELIKEKQLKKADEFELLLTLGRETINNPFHLVPAQ